MKSAAELLPSIYRKMAREAADEQTLLIALWPVVVGEKVAGRTRPVRLFGQTFIVEAATQVWRKQLAQMRSEIIARLNAASGRPIVKDLEFRVEVSTARRPPGRAPSAASSAGAETGDEADRIRDPHLRRLYRLSRQREKGR